MGRSRFEVLVVILAGGNGTRLAPLTDTRSKPAGPLGGKYRLIDIPLSNAYNSDLRKILVLTQGKDNSLVRHIRKAWPADEKSDSFTNIITPQEMGIFYKGDADAVKHALNDIQYHQPDYVLIVPGDHLLKMNYRNLVSFLHEKRGDAVISIIPRPLAKAKDFGSLSLDENSKIREFREKDPLTPFRTPAEDTFYASMGIYAFRADILYEALNKDGYLFGKDVIPRMLGEKKILGYDYFIYNHISEVIIHRGSKALEERFVENSPHSGYWRDVGTVGEYFDANMDLVSVTPKFNLYGEEWPFFTIDNNLGPAKIINPEYRSSVESAIICEGSFLSDVRGRDLVISPRVFVDKSELNQVIVFNQSKINSCRIRRTIVDKHVHLRNMEIGYDKEKDLSRGIHVDPQSEVRVVPKYYHGEN